MTGSRTTPAPWRTWQGHPATDLAETLSRSTVTGLKLRCPRSEQSPPCRGSVVLRTKSRFKFRGKRRHVVLARRKFRIGAGRTVRVRLKIAARKAKLLRRKRAARRVQAIARVRDGAGNRGSTLRLLRIVPR